MPSYRTKGSYDYTYDVNGNMVLDNNKAISGITYNHLNLPNVITVTAKGNITYTYDAAGNKISKVTLDNTVTPSLTTTTLYLGGFVYQNDTLQFINQEEGRIRWAKHKYLNGTTAYGFEYDYFLKDHLGNVRMVLTQQKDTAQYVATMEAAYRATESQLFYNIPASNYSRAAVTGYPSDPTTNPNDSLMRLNGSGQKVGAAIILKVMSGDVVDIAVKAFYKDQTYSAPNNSVNDILNALANGTYSLTGGSKGTLAELNNTGVSPLFVAINSFITNSNPTIPSKPRAHLNWILLDEQLQYVNSYPQSGALAVGNYASNTLNTLAYTGITITKNGFLYIYVNNETPGWDVFFDNLSVKQYTGPMLEETHYYPFGLTMANISSKAFGKLRNNLKWNAGSELQNQEFSDGSGLELYATFFRALDPQLGRCWQIDPKPNVDESPYAIMGNNPMLKNDPLGDTSRPGFNDSKVKEMQTYFKSNATKHAGGTADDCITCHNKGMKIVTGNEKLRTGSTASETREKMQSDGYAGETKKVGFNQKSGKEAKAAPQAETMQESLSQYLQDASKDVGFGKTAVFGVSIMDGYHTMTLTVKKDDSFPFRNGLGIQGGPEFTVSDQGTRMGTVGKGNMKFSSTESLDAHLTNYVKRNASATTRDGSPYPAKIEVHQILNKE